MKSFASDEGAGAFFNKQVAPADQKLVNSATQTEQKGRVGGVDNVTGKPVTKETQSRATNVRKFFGYILEVPNLKGKPTPAQAPRSPYIFTPPKSQ